MAKFKLVGTFGALIVEGSFRDVNIAHSALKAYGIADRKYEIVKVEENSYGLTTDQIDDIYQAVLEQFVEHNSGSDCLSDICSDGFRGLSEYDLDELTTALLHDDPRPPSQLVPGISPALESVCLRALAKEPGARFQYSNVGFEVLGGIIEAVSGQRRAIAASAARSLLSSAVSSAWAARSE